MEMYSSIYGLEMRRIRKSTGFFLPQIG